MTGDTYGAEWQEGPRRLVVGCMASSPTRPELTGLVTHLFMGDLGVSAVVKADSGKWITVDVREAGDYTMEEPS